MSDSRPASSITTRPKLEALVADLRKEGQFAFDTEFVSEDSFEPELGLIQVASRKRLATIDPLSIDDLSSFWELALDPKVEVIMHASGEDLRILKFKTGRLPARVVDVQRSAGLVGINYPSGLGTLTSSLLGITLENRETRTDWRKRPLSPAQLRYALDDVRHLLALHDAISRRLETLGRRDWAEQEYTDMLANLANRDDEERWRRLPGLGQLSRRGLEAARRLWHWRRDFAKQLNQPVRRVMRDDILVALAKRLPVHRADLEALRDFQHTRARSRSEEILRIIAEAKAVPDADLPQRAERADESRAPSMVVSLLSAVLHRCCAEQEVSPALAGSTSDLRDLVRWQTGGIAPDQPPSLARGWRKTVCGNVLVDVVAGRRALRVADPAADLPIVIEPVSDH